MFNWRSRALPAVAGLAAALASSAAWSGDAPTPGTPAINLQGTSTADHAAELARDAPAATPDTSHVGRYGIGAVPTEEQIKGWAIAVLPDGTGLPPGRGDVSHGADVFSAQCAMCHGAFGEGEGRYPKLASNDKLTSDQPDRTVGNFWPYATTLWDYINRAMPFPTPHMLPADDVYAITAYILNLNNVVGDDFVADSASLPKVVMPNRHGFLLLDPRPDTADAECMKDCRKPADVRVAATAEGSQVTPRETGPLDAMQPK